MLEKEDTKKVVIFTNTKISAEKLSKHLHSHNIKNTYTHGDKNQRDRNKAIKLFANSTTIHILIATDLIARGIDIPDISHVFNYSIPQQLEYYTHRIGRTGRAGKKGIAYTFCDDQNISKLQILQPMIGDNLKIEEDHVFHTTEFLKGGHAKVSAKNKKIHFKFKTIKEKREHSKRDPDKAKNRLKAKKKKFFDAKEPQGKKKKTFSRFKKK